MPEQAIAKQDPAADDGAGGTERRQQRQSSRQKDAADREETESQGSDRNFVAEAESAECPRVRGSGGRVIGTADRAPCVPDDKLHTVTYMADLAIHDPGVEAARERADAVPRTPAAAPRGSHRVLVGTAGWTDKTLTARGVFYPPAASSAEARLRYYATRFPLVEVDATYYALPAPRMAEYWVERTPPEFVFDIKAFALMTGHPVETARLPLELRSTLPPAVAKKPRAYPKDLPRETIDAVWGTFRSALEPLVQAQKLGAVLLQYPRWFLPGSQSREMILEARERLAGLPCAIEFRNQRWFTSNTAERTLEFLSSQRLPYVVVDEPQGLESSVPALAEVTSPDLAIVRMHGRRGDLWEKPGVSTTERYRYLYDRSQLAEWLPRISALSTKATRTHVVFNNCYANYGTTNALEMQDLLLR
jgi:uncharacterized protein YecE (DUF72 family)